MKTIAEQLNIKEFPFNIKDENENVIYYEDSDGCWSKREFDSDGNRIYSEDSSGFWYKQEFDSDGREVYFEGSNEYWCRREFDSDGNEIYYENSKGKIIDNRPKSLEGKVVEIEGFKYELKTKK